MSYFMVEIELPKTITQEFILLIPNQRKFVDRMMKEGEIVSYSVSFDRSKIWVVIITDSIHEVRNVIGSFPIIDHIRFKISNLLFHEMSAQVPQFWLN